MKIALGAIAVASVLAGPAIAQAEALDLICEGTALHTETTETFAQATSSSGVSASGDATTFRRARTTEVMRIHLDGNGRGKLKLPASLIPPISIGKDGWWDFVKLDVSEDAIRGKISLNVLNRPRVLIDRHTGDIDMRGLGMRFQGACEKAPDVATERKF